MAKTIERQIAEVLDDEIRARAYGVTRLAGELGCATRTIDRWCSEETTPSSADLLRLLAAVGRSDPERALRIASRFLRLAGLEAHRAPREEPRPGDAHAESCDVVEAAADLERAVRHAAEDGVIAADEQARIANAALRVVREASEVPAVAAAVGTPELALAGVSR